MQLIDTNVHLGPWPFTPAPDRTGPELAAHLRERGIARALVSHLGTVFQPEPMVTNRRLFATVRRTPNLHPVPTLNPALANWREQLAECLAAGPIRAVKLYPNYHNYSLAARRLDAFMAAIADAKLRLIVNVRLEDERHRYFGLKIKGVPVKQLDAFLARNPAHHVLFTGIGKGEIEQLAAKHANFSAEIAFVEITNVLEVLLGTFPARRLMLGTATPLLNTRAGADKLRCAHIPAKAKALIGADNARRFFNL